MYARRVHFKKNPATLTFNDWKAEINTKKSNNAPNSVSNSVSNSSTQIHLQGQKNVVQIKDLEAFLAQKKWHFSYIYTQNMHISLVNKNENNQNENTENKNDKILEKPFALPAPVQIDSFVIEKNKFDIQYFGQNNQLKNTQSCKEFNAKFVQMQIEKDFLENKNLPTFGKNSNIEIVEYKGDFVQQGHQVLAKKMVFSHENQSFWAENLQTIPYQNKVEENN